MSEVSTVLYEWSIVDDVAVVQPTVHEITSPEVARQFGAQVAALLDSGQKRVALDLGPIKYLSSTAFGVLANLARRFQASGGVLKAFNMDPMVRMGADIIRLGELIPIYETERDALSTFRAS